MACPVFHIIINGIGVMLSLSLLDGDLVEAGNKPPASFVDFDRNSGEVHRFHEPGDLLLGAILPIHDYDERDPCGNKLRETGVVQHVEALRYAIDLVNRNQSILPGLTLGLVVLDDCATSVTALGQALHFMPIHSTAREEFDFYPVIGVIGSESSPASVMIANVLGMFGIPQISPTASSDLLSDKERFPYFLRMVPPDRYQVHSIIDLIQHFNWTYISAVYSKGGFGESALELFLDIAPKYGICVGSVIGIKQSERNKWALFDQALNTLLDAGAKVVILFTDQDVTRGILKATKQARLTDSFVWIGSDGMGINIDDLDGVEEEALGALLFKSYSIEVADFRDYFESLRPTDRDANPWMKAMWAELFHCRWDHDADSDRNLARCDPSLDITLAEDYFPEAANSILIDAVNVFAKALHDLIATRCPHSFNRPNWEKSARTWKYSLQNCTNGLHLLRYLRNISFDGHNGRIEFDQNGDILGMYEVLNFQHKDGRYVTEQIALWKVDTEKLSVNESEIRWGRNHSQSVPTSRCGDLCRRGQVYSYYKGTCCWECRTCRANEITMDNATKCVDCPLFEWPDQQTFDRCRPLEPYYLRWHHPAVIVFVLLSTLGVVYCTIVFVVYITHNNVRLIKSTSRELAYIILGGVTLQYVLLFIVVSKPSTFVCYITYMGFNVSFTVVYAALLTRTNRIYRIFYAGKRTKKLPPFTSPTSQVIIALILIGIQIIKRSPLSGDVEHLIFFAIEHSADQTVNFIL
ncbi:hypothetical protein LSH36_664g01035 [Paralvinella palmiformis]|uniref:G-protein coupled receptors family 3 profile domain-containing protein n=1 Tax=Paralvinella palmiformis TaxID=53620 RepID=A0AAD9MWK4_9ANNE|nr:hypothetical protein LSH36_664g01035 [Paralvinella palmiformis]